MPRKLRFFLTGLIPGLIFVFFVLNRKGVQCSGYLPNSRVLTQLQSLPIRFAPHLQAQVKQMNLDEKLLKSELLSIGEVDFDSSHIREVDCPEYHIQTPKQKPKYRLVIVRCENEATLTSIQEIK